MVCFMASIQNGEESYHVLLLQQPREVRVTRWLQEYTPWRLKIGGQPNFSVWGHASLAKFYKLSKLQYSQILICKMRIIKVQTQQASFWNKMKHVST